MSEQPWIVKDGDGPRVRAAKVHMAGCAARNSHFEDQKVCSAVPCRCGVTVGERFGDRIEHLLRVIRGAQ